MCGHSPKRPEPYFQLSGNPPLAMMSGGFELYLKMAEEMARTNGLDVVAKLPTVSTEAVRILADVSHIDTRRLARSGGASRGRRLAH